MWKLASFETSSLLSEMIPWPWSPNGHGHEWPTATPLCNVNQPSHSFDLQNSKVKVMVKIKVMAKVILDDQIWALEFNRYVCFSFRGNRTIFGWDIGKLYLTLKIQGQGHGQGQTRWSHLSPRVQSVCLLFVSWQSDHFWLRYSKFHIWPWKI